MKKRRNNYYQQSLFPWSALILVMFFMFVVGCKKDSQTDPVINSTNGDVNGDGIINIMVIGTSKSIKSGAEAFSPNSIATELQSILLADNSISFDVNVVAEDIYQDKLVLTSIAGIPGESDKIYYRHSLAQYYYWPDGRDARMKNLAGTGDVDWDYVVIGADPYIVSTTPGFYSLGINKVAAKVAEGEAKPLLLMLWSKGGTSVASIEHFEEYTYRTSDGAKVNLPTIPAGLAWEALPEGKKDSAPIHPTPNGAYLAAACIYAHIYNKSASSSEYLYDDELANVALSTITNEANQVHYTGYRTFISPFKGCDITDQVLNYNHTGSSTEDGILNGLTWVLAKANVSLEFNGTPPINFNYGRANTNYEASKRYKIDPAQFDFSLGFPVQDGGSTGDVSMLYGVDLRGGGT